MYWMISFCITIDWLSNVANQYYQVGTADSGRRPANMPKVLRGNFVMTFWMFTALQPVTLATYAATKYDYVVLHKIQIATCGDSPEHCRHCVETRSQIVAVNDLKIDRKILVRQ